MAIPPPAHESFKRRLRLAMVEAGFVHEHGPNAGEPNVYGFARVFDPTDPHRGERVLRRWLASESTTIPSRASRRSLARALGRDEDFFVPQLGARELTEIRRARGEARIKEEIARRRVWVAPGSGFDGHFLPDELRELIS